MSRNQKTGSLTPDPNVKCEALERVSTRQSIISPVLSPEAIPTSAASPDKKSLFRRLFPRTVYKSPREKRFVRKLDFFLLSACSLAYFIKSIDQSNISNAYVSGMKEELNFRGTQYNKLDSFFKAGYAIFLIPSQVMINKIKPNYWLAFCELIWGILTGLCAIPNTPEGLYPIRFFIGAFESSSWPGIVTTLMNFYTKEELATRIGVFQASYYGGLMFSGFLQASIHKTLNGRLGVSGWRWLFIINAIMTVVTALVLVFLLPDNPAHGGSKYWMNEEDREIALERMERVGRNTKRNVTLKEIYSTVFNWRTWLFISAYCTKAFCIAWGYFNLYLKSLKNSDGTKTWSVEQINLIPIGGNAISFFFVIVWAKLSDLTQRPIYFLVGQLLVDFVAYIILAVWPSGRGIKYFAFFSIPVADAFTSLLISLLAEVYNGSPGRRAIMTGLAVVLVYSNNAWLPLVLWPADQAPHYKYGYDIACLFLGVSLISTVIYYKFVYLPAVEKNEKDRENKDPATEEDEIENESESQVLNVQELVKTKT